MSGYRNNLKVELQQITPPKRQALTVNVSSRLISLYVNDRLVRRRGRGRRIFLLMFSQGDDGGGAGGPSGQYLDSRDKFHGKRGQKQNVKAYGPADGQHCYAINGGVQEKPIQRPQRSEQELQAISHHGDGHRENHPHRCKRRRTEEGIKLLRQIHCLLKNMNRVEKSRI